MKKASEPRNVNPSVVKLGVVDLLAIRNQETFSLIQFFQLSPSTEPSTMLCSPTLKLHFDLILVVGILILFRWMTIDMFECVFVIEHTFIIVNIYRLVFCLGQTKVLIALKRISCHIHKEYTTYPPLKIKSCVTTQCAFNVHSLCHQ